MEAEVVKRAQVLKDGKLMQFQITEQALSNGETMVDKSVLLRPHADLFMFKLV